MLQQRISPMFRTRGIHIDGHKEDQRSLGCRQLGKIWPASEFIWREIVINVIEAISKRSQMFWNTL